MKKILVVLFLFFLCIHQSAFANGAGLPPFFKVNGKLSTPNPLQLYGITASTFLIPQDFAPENYLVNQPINFEIDETPLQTVINSSLFKKKEFLWDFGDGSKAEGLTNTHAYSKIGSYILVLTINIYTDQDPTPIQFIDSFLLNILPDKNFSHFPQAVILLNGTQIKNPLDNRFSANLSNPIKLDASKSIDHGSKLVTYLWNFGDGETGSKTIETHKYTNPFNETVVLRVKDSNGFISDTFVGVQNSPDIQNNTVVVANTEKKSWFDFIPFVILPLCVILLIGSFLIKRKSTPIPDASVKEENI